VGLGRSDVMGYRSARQTKPTESKEAWREILIWLGSSRTDQKLSEAIKSYALPVSF
jgi:hypothetical protein